MHNGLFHQNCECTYNIYRPFNEATCVVNTTIFLVLETCVTSSYVGRERQMSSIS